MDGGKKDGRGRGEFRVGTEQSQCVLLAVSLLQPLQAGTMTAQQRQLRYCCSVHHRTRAVLLKRRHHTESPDCAGCVRASWS